MQIIVVWRCTWAASEMSRTTRSLFGMMSNTSPRVPSSSEKPHALACTQILGNHMQYKVLLLAESAKCCICT